MLDDFLARLVQSYKEDTGLEVANVREIPDLWQKEEMAVDGPTLTFILDDSASLGLKDKLALLAAHCRGVVVSRSSPSQKAAVVKMMAEYEMAQAAGGRRGLSRWYARYKRRMQGKMLSIGDGANDVAMLQTADVGVGIMGKEGRQAVNNSDYAFAQFRWVGGKGSILRNLDSAVTSPALSCSGTCSWGRLRAELGLAAPGCTAGWVACGQCWGQADGVLAAACPAAFPLPLAGSWCRCCSSTATCPTTAWLV